jgi:small subunit ribosomal protein S7
MRGRPLIKKRKLAPDPKYNSVLVAKFINQVMRKGKKLKATKIVYKTFDLIKKETKSDPLQIFEQAINNVVPYLEVRARRIGGAVYQIPFEVKKDRGITLAMRWIINAAREKQGKPMEEFLAREIIDAYNKTGEAIKKRDELHRMAEANRAFAHFARFG